MKEKFNPISQKFHRLTVLEEITIPKITGKKQPRKFKCQCDCGKISIVQLQKLKTGHTKSCGCLLIEKAIEKFNIINKIASQNKQDPKIIAARIAYKGSSYHDGNISFEDFLTLSQQNCFYCNKSPSNKQYYKEYKQERREEASFIYNGLDILNKKSQSNQLYIHNKENTVVCCNQCNMLKHDLYFEDFIQLIIKTYKNTQNYNLTPISFPSKTNLIDELFNNKFLKNYRNKICRTHKGQGLYNRFWNYLDKRNKKLANQLANVNEHNLLTYEKFFYLSQFPCFYCGTKESNFIKYKEDDQILYHYYNGLDRINQKLPHTIDNCIPCCLTCNITKQELNLSEYIKWINKVYTTLTNKNIII